MTNNSENDPNEEFLESEASTGEEQKPGVVGNLAEAWRTRPLFKFLVLIVAVFAVSIAAVSFLGGGNTNSDLTHISRPPTMREAPGGTVSPYMKAQTELANKERSEQAIASGGSALPTPIGQTTDIGNFGDQNKKDDPLNELRAEVERLQKQNVVQQAETQKIVQQVQQQQRPPESFDNSLAEAMQRQMQQLLESWSPRGIKSVTVLKEDDLKDKVVAVSSPGSVVNASEQQKILVNAGTVSYAQLLTEANSDVPGPIMAQIVSGPLSGARAIGAFQVANGYEKYLVLKFTLADRKGKDYQINAIALDPETTLGGMATEVDERYFSRVVLPAAAGFLQGLGQAMSQGNTEISTNGSSSISRQAGHGIRQGLYNGLGQGAETMSQFFLNQANVTKPLVRVASGTPMGIFFVSPVYEQTVNGQPYQPYPNGAIQPGMNGAYPGTTVSGYGYGEPLPQGGGMPYPNYSSQTYGYGNYGNSGNYYRGQSGAPQSPMGQSYSPYGGGGYGQ